MRVLKVSPDNFPAEAISEVRKVIREGGVIAYPTETVYGLGADIFNEDAVNRLHSIKGRDAGKPLSIALPSPSEIARYAHVDSELQEEFIKKNLPGPFTVILRKKSIVPDWISKETVGIRIPEYAGTRQMLAECGPVTSTSANPSGLPAAVNAEQIHATIRKSVDLILDGGETRYRKPSQVVDIVRMEVIRQ